MDTPGHVRDRYASTRPRHVEHVGAQHLALVDQHGMGVEPFDGARTGAAVGWRVEVGKEQARPVAPDERLLAGREGYRRPGQKPVQMGQMHVPQPSECVHTNDHQRTRPRLADEDCERAQRQRLT